MYARADCSGKTAERFVIWRYIFIVVVIVSLIQYKMAEGHRDEISDTVETVRKGALNPFIDDSVISERIAALKRSKAGHLGEITKIYRKLDGYLEDYKLSVEVGSEAHRLDTQWKCYSHVYYELIKLLADEGDEKMHEEDRYARNSEIYYDYVKSINQYMAGVEEQIRVPPMVKALKQIVLWISPRYSRLICHYSIVGKIIKVFALAAREGLVHPGLI